MVLELQFWQHFCLAGEVGADAPHQPLSVPWARWQGHALGFARRDSFLQLLERTKQPNQNAPGDKHKIIENLGGNFSLEK